MNINRDLVKILTRTDTFLKYSIFENIVPNTPKKKTCKTKLAVGKLEQEENCFKLIVLQTCLNHIKTMSPGIIL